MTLRAQVLPSATMQLDTNVVLIGDRVGLKIVINKIERKDDLLLPTFDSLKKIADLEIVGQTAWQEKKTPHNFTTLEKQVVLQAFDSGLFVLPPLHFSYKNADGTLTQSSAPSLSLRVRPVALNPARDTTIADIKNIDEEKANWEDWQWYVYAALGFIALLFLLRRFLFGRKKQKTVVEHKPLVVAKKEAPDVVARRKLQQLRLPQDDESVKIYYNKLSYIVREYIEGRFGVDALESTTHETLLALSSAPSYCDLFGEGHKKELSEILTTSDMVKFAKTTPSQPTHLHLLNLAKTFVENTKEVKVN